MHPTQPRPSAFGRVGCIINHNSYTGSVKKQTHKAIAVVVAHYIIYFFISHLVGTQYLSEYHMRGGAASLRSLSPSSSAGTMQGFWGAGEIWDSGEQGTRWGSQEVEQQLAATK